MRCYCGMDSEELDKEYGRMSRAHVTIMAALKALKISSPTSTTQITQAALAMTASEIRLKALLKDRKEQEASPEDVSGVPL